jgi:hypothetical protein
LVEAQKVWLKIKENGIENKLKEECRNVISEALQGLEQFDEAEQFNVQNISCHNKSIRAHIIAMRNAVHNKRWDKVKEEVNLTDMFIAKLEKPEKGDFVGNMFRNQMIDVMNHTNQLLGRNESFDYDDPEPDISKKFLPPLPQQILSNTASEAPDVILEEQKTDQEYDPKLSKVQNNANRLRKAIALAEKMKKTQTF